ncbi:MAG: thymidine kinase [Bacilli bacterium]|nr:thymidine kinase [Bacilli bacterium]
MAKLIFKYATMNSGKTIDLIRTVYNYKENNCKVIVMKPLIDTKAGNYIETRIGLKRKVDFLIDEKDLIVDILSGQLKNVKCIFIDEAQFLTSSQVDELFKITKICDIPVICYGLRTNFKMKSFKGSQRLLEIADSLEEFKTLCFCGETARYVGRRLNGSFISKGKDIVIDGTENIEYVPLCGKHYLKEVSKVNFDEFYKCITKKDIN